MPENKSKSILASLLAAGNLSAHLSVGPGAGISWGKLAATSDIANRFAATRGRSVVVAPLDQLAAAAALIQLDGIAKRIVLYPPDMSREHLAFVADCAEANLILTDEPSHRSIDPRVECLGTQGWRSAAGSPRRSSEIETEWVLLTSGTTGRPKLVAHTLRSLTGAIRTGSSRSIVWGTFYDIRRYGGLQILLRAILGGTPLVLKSPQESTVEFLARAGALGVTHILGTPSHWRSVMMSSSAGRIEPVYVRLSGEIADQAILNQLGSQYPQARIVHAFASTEAGVIFEVDDCLIGCPAGVIDRTPGVEMKVESGTLRVRSSRTAFRYLGKDAPALKDADGFVDTGDALDLRDGRFHFVGRRDGIINVGGRKVHPEEIEAVINRHPEVSMSLVKARKNPITGTLVVAEVVLKEASQAVPEPSQALQLEILRFCRQELAHYKVPAAIKFVPALAVSQTGKLMRHA